MFNIPTIITLSRIFITLIVFFAVFFNKFSLLLPCFLIGSATDWLDGFLARALKQTTSIGAMLDPIADKIFVCSWYIIFGFFHTPYVLPKWFVWFIIFKELILIFGSAILFLKNKRFKIVPSYLAKFLMTIYLILIFVVLRNISVLIDPLIFLIVILSACVLIDYGFKEKQYV